MVKLKRDFSSNITEREREEKRERGKEREREEKREREREEKREREREREGVRMITEATRFKRDAQSLSLTLLFKNCFCFSSNFFFFNLIFNIV